MFFPEGHLWKTPQNQQTIATIEGLQEAMAHQSIVEAKAVLCDNQHNLWVEMPACQGMIPRNQGALGIETGAVRDIALIARVGRPVCFTVERLIPQENRPPLAILSRINAQQQCRRQYLERLIPGDVISARITHLEPFGAFCDVGCGIPSLIPIDSISVSRIFHPKERFFPGQTIKAVVTAMDDQGKLHLSHKELLGTWEENAGLFCPGETVTGIVRTVESYGSFVELTPNLAGLAEPKEGVLAGQQAAVFIKSMIPEKMKVKLIIVNTASCQEPPRELRYFFKGKHLSRWQYSPAGCQKSMVSHFDAEGEFSPEPGYNIVT